MPAARTKVNADVIRWAIAYSQREPDLRASFGTLLEQWESGDTRPTWRELERFAREARVPVAYLYGDRIPDLSIDDLPHMRATGDAPMSEPSPGLTATIRACFLRQDWYRDYAERSGLPHRRFVGSCEQSDEPSEAARNIKADLAWENRDVARRPADTYRRWLAELAEEAGVLVMVDEFVGDDREWTLDAEEFRGFSLVDDLAPLVFINGNDSLPAQAFTLAHELAHIWLGEPGVSAPDATEEPAHPVEIWCNNVAAELLVPTEQLIEIVHPQMDVVACLPELEKRFDLSRLVMLRRLRLAGMIKRTEFEQLYPEALMMSRRRPVPEAAALMVSDNGEAEVGEQDALFPLSELSNELPPAGAAVEPSNVPEAIQRVGTRFASAIYQDTKQGGTLFTEAYELLDISDADDLEAVGRTSNVFA